MLGTSAALQFQAFSSEHGDLRVGGQCGGSSFQTRRLSLMSPSLPPRTNSQACSGLRSPTELLVKGVDRRLETNPAAVSYSSGTQDLAVIALRTNPPCPPIQPKLRWLHRPGARVVWGKFYKPLFPRLSKRVLEITVRGGQWGMREFPMVWTVNRVCPRD